MKVISPLRRLSGPYGLHLVPRSPLSRRAARSWQRRRHAAEQFEARRLLSGAAPREPSWPPPAAPDAAEASSASVLISEIMYHPLEDDPRDEYLELFNPTGASINLRGWQLTRGVHFEFPDRELPPGGFVVVAADRERFALQHPDVSPVVGDWTGRLSNRGETVELVDALGIPVNRVRYADQGDWAVRVEGELDHGHRGWTWLAEHDGGGPSLELIQWQLPNDAGQNWGASLSVGGTPGRSNSIASSDLPPLILDVQHQPALPQSTDPIVVTAKLLDESRSPLSARVVYQIDGQSASRQVSMYDDGLHQDQFPGDGIYGAVLPAQPDGTILKFHIEVKDSAGQQRIWPVAEATEDGGRPDALIQVLDTAGLPSGLQPGDPPLTYLILTAAERSELADIGDGPLEEAQSNALMNGTFIRVDGRGVEVRYGVGVRNRGGASRIGPPNNYRVDFAHDRPWNDVVAVNFNCQYVHSQIVGSAVYRLAGIPAAEAIPVKVFVNGVDAAEPGGPRMFGIFAQLEVIDSSFPDEHFPEDAGGNLYRAVAAGGESGDLRDEGPDAEAYRDTYRKRTNDGLEDWSDLIQLTDVLNNTPDEEFFARVSEVIDVEQWMQFLAVDALLGNRETGLSMGTGDNYWLYRGQIDPRFRLIPHDLDTLMGCGRLPQPNRSIFTYTAVPGLRRLLTHPATAPLYYRAFLDVMQRVYNEQTMHPLLEHLLSGFVPSGEIQELQQYVTDRIQGVMAQLPHEFALSSDLPIVGEYHRTTQPVAELAGTAYAVETQSVTVNGQLADWSPLTREWSIAARGEGRSLLLIEQGATWQYLDDGSDAQRRWRRLDFDDSAWSAGPAPLGYGVGDEGSLVSFGPNPYDKFITTYFRREFDVADPTQVLDLTLRLQVDDGAVVYLNDQEIVRHNMPAGAIDFQTVASQWVGGHAQQVFHSFGVDPQQLQPGQNLLAVEVHQRSAVDTDLRLDLSLEARTGRLEGGVPLHPGINRVQVQAFDGPAGTGQEVDRAAIDLWYDGATPQNPEACQLLRQQRQLAPANLEEGVLERDTVLAPCGPAYQVTGELIVPDGVTLTVLPGTSVFFHAGAGITIEGGRLLAEGEPYAPIRFTRPPEANSTWAGIQFRDSLRDNHLAHAVLEYGVTDEGMVGLENSRLTIESVTFDHTDLFRIRTVNSSLIVRNSTFTDIFAADQDPTTDNRSEHIWGSGILEGGQLLIENNWFGTTKGHNDAVDFDGAVRPGPIPRILNNEFNGGGDDALDLETDAHVEGNLFRNYIKDIFNGSSGDSNAISAGAGREYVVARNVFFNVDHAVQVKDDAFLTFEHNTVVQGHKAPIYFEMDERGPGRGALVTDSILQDVPQAFAAVRPTTDLQVHRCILPADGQPFGDGNESADPRLADPAGGDFHLRAGSPALGSGLQGRDRGALVPAGATLSGQPARITGQNTALLQVAGAGLIAYRYRVNQGPWSQPRSLDQPIELTDLADGDYVISVLGQDSAGLWSPETQATQSETWSVDTSSLLLRINEILALNTQICGGPQGYPDIVELFNGGSRIVDLSGMSLTDNPAQPRRFVFPAGTQLEAQSYLVLAADAVPSSLGMSLGFRLEGSGEGLYLYDRPERGGTQLDAVEFGLQIPDLSLSRLGPDGQWGLAQPTPGAPNVRQPTGDPATLVINEWLAVNRTRVTDDFLELYNPDPLPVDLSGFLLTDDPVSRPLRHRVPPLSFIAGQGHVTFWADGDPSAGADHLDFELAGDHELLALLDPSGKPVDQMLYFHQLADHSQARLPDGAAHTGYPAYPSPGHYNPLQTSLQQSLVRFDDTWAYQVTGMQPPEEWTGIELDDADWPRGPGVFAAGTGQLPEPVRTQLPTGPITYYFRHSFQVPPEWLADGVELTLELQTLIDDGAVVYLNGSPVVRLGLPEQVTAATRAQRGIGVARYEGPFAVPRSLLRPWDNILAVEVHQVSPSSADVVMGVSLVAYVSVVDPFAARMEQLLDGLRVTEIMYHPAGDAVAEYLELRNTTDRALDLTGVRLRGGVDFTFPAVSLDPGAHGLVVCDRAAFQRVYGDGYDILGEFTGRLSNGSDEMELLLPEPLDVTIERIGYQDAWYPQTDGDGYSLVAARPDVSEADGSVITAWRPSSRAGGSPGAMDPTPLPGDVNQDGHLTSSDVDELCLAIASGRNDAIFDLNQDRRVTREDLDQLLAEGFQTGPGDVNLDGIFNSSDFVQVFQAGQYEDGRPFNLRWTTGDWNCDGEFDSSDLVLAFQGGHYERTTAGSEIAAAVDWLFAQDQRVSRLRAYVA